MLLSLCFLLFLCSVHADQLCKQENEHTMAFHEIKKGGNLFYVDTHGTGSSQPNQVMVLLHGAKYSHQTWCDLNTYSYFADKGYRVIGVDLPGKGKSDSKIVTTRQFLKLFLENLNIKKAVIVSPSMSGMYSLPALMSSPELFAAYIPVAPITRLHGLDKLSEVNVPTMHVYGSEDGMGDHANTVLGAINGMQSHVIDKGEHACYLAPHTDEFHTTVSQFLESAELDWTSKDD